MSALSNLKISQKLYALILIAMLALAGLAVATQYQMGRVFDKANYATVNTVPSFIALYEVEAHFLLLRIHARDHILNSDDLKMVAIDRSIQEEREGIVRALDHYGNKLIANAEDKQLLDVLRAALKDYYIGLDQTLALSRMNKNVEARDQAEKIVPSVAKLEQALQNHIAFNKKLADANSAEALATKNEAFWMALLLTILMLAVLSSLGWVIANHALARPIGLVADNLQQLAQGRMDVTVQGTGRRDEIGDMARAAQVFKEFVQKLDTQSWTKSHVSEISSALQQADDFRTLTQVAVSKIAPVMGAGHGAFYVTDSDGRYTLQASYGYRERKHLNNSFAVGEGLVGQCAMEKAPIMLTAPKDYIRINSGLGEGPPACIIVQPIMHNDRVLGVLEMASFQQFSEREKAVLDALQPVLATSMEILDRNLKTRELLVATQEQAERMEKQAAQLEEQQVEMEAQQAELLETENWFRSIIESSPDGMLVADTSGQILLTNPEIERIFGYEPGELIGGHIEHLVPEHARGGHDGLRHAFMAEGRSRSMGASPYLTGLRKDGKEVNVSITLSPLPPRGTRGKCVSVSVRKIEA